jgi:hypothetical protein
MYQHGDPLHGRPSKLQLCISHNQWDGHKPTLRDHVNVFNNPFIEHGWGDIFYVEGFSQ